MQVNEFGLDGVDIDFEATPQCSFNADRTAVTCDTDASIIRAIRELRAALPRPKIVSDDADC